MADIYGSHFEFGGQTSRQYGLIFANIETDRFTQLGGSPSTQTVFNKKEKRNHIVADDYSDSAIPFDVEIVTDEPRVLNITEQRKIEKWLFNRRSYRKLYIDIIDDLCGDTFDYIDNEKKRNYLNCRFINPEKLEYNGGIVGYKATIETDSSYMWQEPVEQSFTVNNATAEASTSITVAVDSDLDDYIYPTVKINIGTIGGDIIISNNSDDAGRLTKFADLPPNATIIMKGNINYISGQYYNKFATRNFIRLLDGDNHLTVLGNVSSIDIEFSNRRFM